MRVYAPEYARERTRPPLILPPSEARIVGPPRCGYEELRHAMPLGHRGAMTGGMQSLTGIETQLLSSSGGGPSIPAGYKYLYDADQNVYKDAGVTLAVNNDPVQQWNDQGGLANMIQATLGNRPLYKTNTLNGHATLQGNGISQVMTPVSGQWTFTGAVDLWTVLKVGTWQSGATPFTAAGTWAPGMVLITSDGHAKTNVATSSHAINFTYVTNVYFLVRIAADASTSSVTINNNAPTSQAFGVGSGATQNMILFDSTGGGTPTVVNIAYQIAYSSVLSVSSASSLQSFLGTRFGLF